MNEPTNIGELSDEDLSVSELRCDIRRPVVFASVLDCV